MSTTLEKHFSMLDSHYSSSQVHHMSHYCMYDTAVDYYVSYERGTVSLVYNARTYKLLEPLHIHEDCHMLYARQIGPFLKLTFFNGYENVAANAWDDDVRMSSDSE